MRSARRFSARLLLLLMILTIVPAAIASDPENCTTCPYDQPPPPPDGPGINCQYLFCYQETIYRSTGEVDVIWHCNCIP